MTSNNKTSAADREQLEKRIAELKAELEGLSKRLNEQGSEAIESAKKTVKEAVDSLKEIYKDDLAALKKHGEDVSTKIKENPVAATAIAAGVGLLVGILSNRSRSK